MLQRLAAEGLGSLLLAATVVGSGIMAERLAAGNLAVALLANTGATVAVLAVLIALIGPISGAHLNPAVSLAQAWRRALPWPEAAAYSLVQLACCALGAMLAHAMFELPLIQSSLHIRTGPAQWLAEIVATAGLILVVISHRRPQVVDGRRLDRRSILVHGINFFRQSRDHHCPLDDRHVFGNSATRCTGVCRGPADRGKPGARGRQRAL